MSNPRIPFQMSDRRRTLPPMAGKPLMVHIVVNLEYWAFDQPMPRALLPSPHGLRSVPDVPNFSWAEYGLRAGLSRFLRLFGERDLPVSVSLNAGVIDVYPQACDAVLNAGWEIIAHGVRQRSLQAEDNEQAVIETSLERIERFSGQRPRGWLGPGLGESFETPDLLSAAGIDHLYDWALDDLPTWMRTSTGPLVAVPYGLELNDSVLHAVESYPSDEIFLRVRDTLAAFSPELVLQPRVLTLGLHPHLLGVPHRVVHLERTLELLMERHDVVFVTGTRLVDWYREVEPADIG